MGFPLQRNTHCSESPGWSTRVRENLAQLIAPSGLMPSSSNGAPIHLLKWNRTGKAGSAQTVSLLTHAGILAALVFLAHGQMRKIIGDAPRHVKVQGTVTLRVLVGMDGKAAQIRVVRGVGYGLDERAIETVRGWKFKAAHDAAGRNVPAWVVIETVFRLF